LNKGKNIRDGGQDLGVVTKQKKEKTNTHEYTIQTLGHNQKTEPKDSGVEDVAEIQIEGIQTCSNEIIAENFPNLL
jgi:hypothetical protein